MIFLYPLIAALASVIFLLIILKLNKEDKKPRGLIIKLLVLSGLSMFGAMILNDVIVSNVLDKTGLSTNSFAYQAILYFLIVPILEEGFKFSVLRLNTWKHSSFTYSYDGIIFGVSAALGFAIIENLIYMIGTGLWVGLVRALFPIHFVCGIYIGHYYMLSKQFSKENNKAKSCYYLAISLLIPMLIHGFYNFVLSYGKDFMLYLLVIFIVILGITTVKSIKKYSKNNYQI